MVCKAPRIPRQYLAEGRPFQGRSCIIDKKLHDLQTLLGAAEESMNRGSENNSFVILGRFRTPLSRDDLASPKLCAVAGPAPERHSCSG